MQRRVSSGRGLAIALAVVVWLWEPLAAGAQAVTGAAGAAWARVAGSTATLAQTGWLTTADDARVASAATGSLPGLGGAEALHAATISSIDGWDALDAVTSVAAMGSLGLIVAGNQIAADFVMAWARAPVGVASSGGSTVEGLRVNGLQLLPSGAANERFYLPGATLEVNQVLAGADRTTVNALRITTWDGLVDVVIATATAGITPGGPTGSTSGSTVPILDPTLDSILAPAPPSTGTGLLP